MWCWRRMEKISWTDHVRNEEVLLRISEQRNILREMRKRRANWIGHILWWNCLLKWVIEGKIKGEIEVTRRRRRRKKLLDDLKERRGYSHLKEEALDRTVWRNSFGRGIGPVVRQITKWMNVPSYPPDPGRMSEKSWPYLKGTSQDVQWKFLGHPAASRHESCPMFRGLTPSPSSGCDRFWCYQTPSTPWRWGRS